MSIVDFVPPRDKQIESEASGILATLKGMTIATNDDFVQVAEITKGLRALDRKITDFFTPLKRKQDEAKRAILDAEKEQRKPVLEAKAIADRMILNYQREQDRIRREEEQRLAKEAQQREEERRLAEAVELEADGDTEGADLILAEPVVAPIISLPSAPKVQGVNTRKTWKAEVTDKLALIRYVAAHPEYQHLLDINHTAVNATARSMKDACPIDGIHTYEEETLAARA